MTKHDASELAYKNGYEAGRADMMNTVNALEGKIRHLEAERDAAVADLKKVKNCVTCKHTNEMDDNLCIKCAMNLRRTKMADLIDRKALLEQFRRKKCYESCGMFDICSVPCSTAKIILDAPAAWLKRGEWIDKCGGFFEIGKCSVCGTKWATSGVNYCPTCGSKMRRGDDDG